MTEFEIRTKRVQLVRYAGPKAVMQKLSRDAQTIGFSVDRSELDSIRPGGLPVAVAKREVALTVKLDLGPHAAGLGERDQRALVSKILVEMHGEAMDGF